jgi:hypothetical protein
MAEEERPKGTTTKDVKEAFLKAGWVEEELESIMAWFRSGWLPRKHSDVEEL